MSIAGLIHPFYPRYHPISYRFCSCCYHATVCSSRRLRFIIWGRLSPYRLSLQDKGCIYRRMIGSASLAHFEGSIWGMKYHRYVYLRVFLSSSMRGTYQSNYTPCPDWSSSVSLLSTYQSDATVVFISNWFSLWLVPITGVHCIFRVNLALYFIWNRLIASALPPGQGIRGCWDRIWVIIGFSSRSQLSAVLASSANCCISEDSTWTAFLVEDMLRV